MAKNNWRDSSNKPAGRPERKSTKATATRSGKSQSTAGARAWQFVYLILAAALLGLMFKILIGYLSPEKKTPIILFPNETANVFLSNSPFQDETLAFFGSDREQANFNGNANIDAQPATLNNIETLAVAANGPQRDVVMFYVFADRFVGSDDKPYLVGKDSLDSTKNVGLKSFLQELCEKDVNNTAATRVVFLDSGRLGTITASHVLPKDFETKAAAVVKELRDEGIQNADKLWLYLSHGDHQCGWASPELNASVFGFFVATGLEGYANTDEDKTITLKELRSYVNESVELWVRNYRDSVQTPTLIGASEGQSESEVELIHFIEKTDRKPTGLETFQSDHDVLWKGAYAIKAPHAKAMAFSRLARLERLRYSKCTEYQTLVQKTKEIIDQGKLEQEPPLYRSSLYDTLPPMAVTAAQSVDCKNDLFLWMNPPKEKNPSPKPKGKLPEPGDFIRNLNPQQQCLLLWEVLKDPENLKPWFDAQKLQLAFDFFAGGIGISKTEVQPDEAQFLVALIAGLPWEKPGFSMLDVSAAIQARHHANLVSRGVLPVPNSQRRELASGFRREWRLVSQEFATLNDQRRKIDDAFFAGEWAGVRQKYLDLVTSYDELAQQLRFRVECRRIAEDGLLMVPYLKAFSARDSICRGAIKTPQEIETEKSFRQAIVALQTNSEIILNKLNSAELRDLERSRAELDQAGAAIVTRLEVAVRGTSDIQTASKYVFEAMALLESPLVEWLQPKQETKDGLRDAIKGRVVEWLERQQAEYFEILTGDRTLEEIDSVTADQQQQAWLTTRDWIADTWPKDKKPWAEKIVSSWDQTQQLKAATPSFESMLKGQEGKSFGSVEEVQAEYRRLERDRLSYLRTGTLLAFGAEPADFTNERIWLQNYLFEFDQSLRVFADLLGNANVADGRPIPFAEYASKYAGNAKEFSRLLGLSTLGINKLKPYDTDSLPTLAEGVAREAAKLSANLRNISPVLSLNNKVVKDSDRFDPRIENSVGSSIQTLRDSIAEIPLIADRNANQAVETQVLWEFRDKTIFSQESMEIEDRTRPLNIRVTRVFRGHIFQNAVALKPMVIKAPKVTRLVSSPNWQRPTFSNIRVDSKDTKAVDLYFLLDCSSSMERDKFSYKLEDDRTQMMSRFEFVKGTLKQTIQQLASEQRFHIGVGSFGSRGDYLFKKGANGDELIIDPKTRKGKFEGGVHPMVDCDLGYSPAGLSTPDNVLGLLQYVDGREAKASLTILYHSMAKLLTAFDSDREKLLVVITDGEDNQDSADMRYRPNSKFETTTMEQLKKIRENYPEIKVFVIQTDIKISRQNPGLVEQLAKADIKLLRLMENNRSELKNHILDAVKRMLYSVYPNDQSSEPEWRSIGQPTSVRVAKPTSFIVETKEVARPEKIQVNLVGGENIRLFNSSRGLEIDYGKKPNTREDEFPRFLEPRLNEFVELGSSRYRVGLLSGNTDNTIRIGFFRTRSRSNSEFPGRVWALVTESSGAQYQLMEPRMSYSTFPIVEFELPELERGGVASKKVGVTLFVRPSVFEQEPTDLSGQGVDFAASGKMDDGIGYSVENVEAGRFSVAIEDASDNFRPFYLTAPTSIDFGPRKVHFQRAIEFKDSKRSLDKFVFEFPGGEETRFNLIVQPPEFVGKQLDRVPKTTGVNKLLDPVFGDEVQAIKFDNIIIEN